MKLEDMRVGLGVRVKAVGAHFKRTGTVVDVSPGDHGGMVLVDMGDGQWLFWPEELNKDKDD